MIREVPIWFAVYVVWASSALLAWPLYARATWREWRGKGKGVSRFALDIRRFTHWMAGGEFWTEHEYEPGQKLRFGITLTLASVAMIGCFFWRVDRTHWALWELAVNWLIVAFSYTGVMIHLYVGWRDEPNKWRTTVWAQLALFFAAWGFAAMFLRHAAVM